MTFPVQFTSFGTLLFGIGLGVFAAAVVLYVALWLAMRSI